MLAGSIGFTFARSAGFDEIFVAIGETGAVADEVVGGDVVPDAVVEVVFVVVVFVVDVVGLPLPCALADCEPFVFGPAPLGLASGPLLFD